jgi:hypothetical protein
VDVEGSEYAVLRRLIESGVLCRRVTDVFVEWHDQAANMATFRWIHSQLNVSHGFYGTVVKGGAHVPRPAAAPCQTRLLAWT